MVVLEGAINNIMGGMENTAGVRLHSHRHKLKQRFDIVKKLGQGTYGKVQLAINKETGQEVAIKTIKKAKIETEQDLVRIRREIQIMSSVQHPQIIHIYEVFENREKMVLVMEYAAGGELYDYLSERKVLPEPEARRVFRQVASAVYYCHKHKICHRDLKLENILLDLDGNAKIADFGLSNVFAEKQRLDTFCGSPLYASPEIVKGIPYVGPEVDCWSLGVLLYTLVYGAMPFDGSNFRRLVKQITQGDFYEPSSPATASELIRHMLTVDSVDRASIEDICNHWWVNEGYADSCLAEAEALASLTPVRLDLLLSLAPKQISSEHMLIQPDEEDVSQKSESERAPPDLTLPPPPTAPPEEEATNGVPMRSHSLGAVPPPGAVNVDLLIERKRKEKKGTGRLPPAGEEEKRAERGKKREASSDGEKRKSGAKRRESSVTRKAPSANTECEEVEKKRPPPKVASPRQVVASSEGKATPKEAPTADKGPPLEDVSPKKAETVDATPVEDRDTEAILKETAAKIEAVEDLMKAEGEEMKSVSSPRVTSPQATSSVVSVASSQAASPTRSRAESESSTDAARTPRSESSSRRQSKIFSKAALFDPVLAAHTSKSPPSPADRGPSKRVTRLGALNMTDLAKKFEEKPVPGADKKSKVASPFKVSDAKKAFEASSDGKPVSESPKRKASVGSSNGDSGIATPREPTVTATLPAKDEKPTCPVKAAAGKTSRESSPLKVSKSSSKNSSVSGSPGKKKERSPPVVPPSQVRSPKKEASPVKQTSKAASVAEDKPPPSSSKATKTEPKSAPVPSPSKDALPSGRRPKETPEPSAQKDSTPRGQDTPLDSSDSESEAEKILRELSVKREKLELAKKEKLKKVTEGKDLSPASTEDDLQSGVRLPSSTSSSMSSTQDVNDHKYATLPRGFRAKPDQPKMNKPKIPTPKMNSFDESSASSDNLRKKSQMEIVLNNRQTPSKRSSFAEIHISPVPPKGEEKSKGEFRTEAQHSVASAAGGAPPEPHLQRARRERIIPIMLEDDLSNGGVGVSDDSRRPPPPTKAPSLSSVSSLPRSSGGLGAVTIPTTVTALSAAEQKKNQTTASPEPIRKSRRERIIPIAVEGEGFVTPPVPEATNVDKVRPPFQRQGSSQGSFSRGRGFTVDRTESFSSAGEDDDDEDDGFQILTAESLFSTLLARVRSLTRKMATDEGGRSGGPGGGERTRRLPHSSANSSSQSAGFWSSLYSPPREIPGSRRVSETSSRRHSRDDDPFESFGPPLWGRSASRDASETESVFSEPSTFSTLPRGWRTRRSGREENVVEGDESLASFTPSRRQFYSRTLSRDHPSLNTDGEDAKMFGNRNSWDASSSTGTLPRSGQAAGPALPTTKFSQEPTSGVASLYDNFSQNRFIPSSGTLDSAGLRDRPLSSSSSGEAKGRVGGHCEQQSSNNAAHLASSTTERNVEDVPKKNKQSMQQLQDLVNELESIPDDVSDQSEKPKIKVELRMTSPFGGGKGSIARVGLAGPNPSKSLSSFQKQRALNDASSSNPNIVYNVALSHPKEKDGQNHLVSTSKSQSNLKSISEKMKQPTSFVKSTPTGSLEEDTVREQNEPIIKNKYSKNYEEKTSKNTFIPYNPNLNPNTSSHKNLYVDKQIGLKKDKSPIPNSGIEIKKDKDWSNSTVVASNTLSLNGKSEKRSEPLGSKMSLQSDNSKHPWNLKQSFSRLNEENKKPSLTRDSKTCVATELYKKARSEDLGPVIDLANAPDSGNKEGTGKGTLKGYRRTKSREVTPAIEAVSERIAQFNSSTLKRISPFEAYRRSKSRELGFTIENVNSGTSDGRMKSPTPSEIVPKSSDAGMSQFEKAKNSIEKKFEKARSPPLETELAKPPYSDSTKESLKLPSTSAGVTDIPKEIEKVVVKEKTPVKENEKAKSMYKILTSKFTRSLSNVGEEKYDPSKNTAKDTEEEIKEREDKVWQKKPSRFLKSKMEKSASRSSFYDMDEAKEEEEEDKSEKKSTKFSNALNKFLGRKNTTEDAITKKVPPTKSTSAAIITDKAKRPPRFSPKDFSKSQENLNQKDPNEATNTTHDTRAKSIFPEEIKSDDVTIESPTKDICNHLSQIDLNITSKIGNVSPYVVTPPPITEAIPTVSTTSSIPSLGSGDGGLLFTTNKGGSWSQQQPPTKGSPLLPPNYDLATRKRSTGEFCEDGSITPTTESGNESIQSPLEDFKEMEDESVMDRITRKSYYSRFNEMKRKPKPKRADTKEAMDQQLAEAKARLLHGELQPKRRSIIRDSMSPTSATPKATSPSFALEGIARKNSKTNLDSRTNSLPPEEGTSYYSAGVRRAMGGHSPLFDESLKSCRYSSDDKDDTSVLYGSMSPSNHEGKMPYRKHTSKSSSNTNELTNYQRSSSARTRDDPSLHLRQPSIPREDLSPFRPPSSRRSSIVKDESQSFRRLSSSNLDDSNLGFKRLSSVPRDDFGYKSLSPSTSRENNPGYHTLQYRKPSSNEHTSFSRYNSACNNNGRDSLAFPSTRSERHIDSTRKSPSISPSITLNQRNSNSSGGAGREDAYGKSEIWGAVASAAGKAAGEAAGKAAGEAAAAVTPEISLDTSRPTLPKSAAEAAAVKSAREELSRRLTPLTRLSNIGHSGNNEPSCKTRPYRKNATSGCLPSRTCDPESTPTVERPPYKRTSTIDLPPKDSRIRTTDYRKVLQDPARRFTGIRSFANGPSSVMLPTIHRCSPSYSPTWGLQSYYSPPSMNTLLRRGSYR